MCLINNRVLYTNEYILNKKDQNELPPWLWLSDIALIPNKSYEGSDTKNSRTGLFFKFILSKQVHHQLLDYLVKLQRFDTLVNSKNKQQAELNKFCLEYALKQTSQYDNNASNTIYLCIKQMYLSLKTINEFCEKWCIRLLKKWLIYLIKLCCFKSKYQISQIYWYKSNWYMTN